MELLKQRGGSVNIEVNVAAISHEYERCSGSLIRVCVARVGGECWAVTNKINEGIHPTTSAFPPSLHGQRVTGHVILGYEPGWAVMIGMIHA